MVKYGVIQGETVYIPESKDVVEKVAIADCARVNNLTRQESEAAA